MFWRYIIRAYHVSVTILRLITRILYAYRFFLLSLLILIFAALAEYTYLNALYLVDDIYDITGPKELSLHEKFTIRVVAVQHPQHLKVFVEKYSLCPTVNEIQLLWSFATPPPDPTTYFTYSKTHSLVSFETYSPHHTDASLLSPMSNISTDAILFIDIDTFLDCDAIAFLHSVWRSAATSAGVGVFPRYVDVATGLLQVPYEVWRKRRYNLLSSAAFMQHKAYSASLAQNTLESSTQLVEYVNKNKECTEFLYYLYAVAQGASRPVWVDVPVQVKAKVLEPKAESKRRSSCIANMMRILGLKELPSSEHRSSRAVEHLIW